MMPSDCCRSLVSVVWLLFLGCSKPDVCQQRYFCDPLTGKKLLAESQEKAGAAVLKAMKELPLRNSSPEESRVRCTVLPSWWNPVSVAITLPKNASQEAVAVGKRLRSEEQAGKKRHLLEIKEARIPASNLQELRDLLAEFHATPNIGEDPSGMIMADGTGWFLEVKDGTRYRALMRTSDPNTIFSRVCEWMLKHGPIPDVFGKENLRGD